MSKFKLIQLMLKLSLTGTATLLLLVCLALYVSARPSLQSDFQNSQAYYSSDGKPLRLTLSEDQQYRLWVKLSDIPSDFQAATLLYEDQYFYQHHGVNLFSLARATYTSYFTSGRRMGASTITMQLARLKFNLNTTTLLGKVQQIWQALTLERHYSKHQILEAYFNLAPYGHNIQGVAAASLTYFHKPPNDLTTAESLLLAVVPQNPNKRLPSTKNGYEQASNARKRLIEMWLKHNTVSRIDRNNLSIPLMVHSPKALPYQAPHFVDRLVQQSKHLDTSILNNAVSTNRRHTAQMQAAPTINAPPVSVFNKRIGITTTLSLELQHAIERLTKHYIDSKRISGLENAAVLILDYGSMEIKAELGSVNYFNRAISGQVNGTQALRSPGSTLKPFIYALALQQGLIHPSSIVKDTPKRFNAYTPENYDKKFIGPLSAREALVRSRNIPAVALMQELKSPSFYDWLGNTYPRRFESQEHYGLALALGGNEVSMLELVQWYAALANHGRYSAAKSVNLPKMSNAIPHRSDNRILTPEASFLTLQMLATNSPPGKTSTTTGLSSPTGTSTKIPWKTGTSFAFRDAWSIGIVGQYVVAVWVGHFDGRANPALIGRQAAAPLFFQIASHLQHDERNMASNWAKLDGLNLKKLGVCKTSGDLDIEHCPDVELDWFIPGVSPFKSNRVFREIQVDTESGLRACHSHMPNSHTEIFEFWPSDIKRLFRQAGIKKTPPPPFMPGCKDAEQGATLDAPDITSPDPNLTYALQSDRLEQEQIPLIANVAGDASKLYWFIDNQFVGQSAPEQPLLWKPKQGRSSVTVIDDIGRSSQSAVRTTLVN